MTQAVTHTPPAPQATDSEGHRGAAQALGWFKSHAGIVTVLLSYVVLNAVVATVVARRNILTAWDTWLATHFGLLLPLLALVLALRAMRLNFAPQPRDWIRIRLGGSRRGLLIRRLAFSSGVFAAVNLTLVVLARFLTQPRAVVPLDSDLWVTCGISLIATVTYMPFFSAMQRLGLGPRGAIIAWIIDLTLGHVAGGWSLLTPHRHLAEMLGTSGIFLVSARSSSWLLLAMALSSSVWILVRTND